MTSLLTKKSVIADDVTSFLLEGFNDNIKPQQAESHVLLFVAQSALARRHLDDLLPFLTDVGLKPVIFTISPSHPSEGIAEAINGLDYMGAISLCLDSTDLEPALVADIQDHGFFWSLSSPLRGKNGGLFTFLWSLQLESKPRTYLLHDADGTFIAESAALQPNNRLSMEDCIDFIENGSDLVIEALMRHLHISSGNTVKRCNLDKDHLLIWEKGIQYSWEHG